MRGLLPKCRIAYSLTQRLHFQFKLHIYASDICLFDMYTINWNDIAHNNTNIQRLLISCRILIMRTEISL